MRRGIWDDLGRVVVVALLICLVLLVLVWLVDLVFVALGIFLVGLDFFTGTVGPFLAGFTGAWYGRSLKVSLPALLLVIVLVRFTFHPLARSVNNWVLGSPGPGVLVTSRDLVGLWWFLPLLVGWCVGSYANWVLRPGLRNMRASGRE